MKTKEDYQKAVDEIKEVCKKHNIALIGTCSSEGIYGEITIMDSNTKPELCWAGAKEVANNIVRMDGDDIYTDGIGQVNYD